MDWDTECLVKVMLLNFGDSSNAVICSFLIRFPNIKFLCILGFFLVWFVVKDVFSYILDFRFLNLFMAKLFFLVFKTALWVYILSVGMRQDVKVGSSV